jgi:hypothetical protein
MNDENGNISLTISVEEEEDIDYNVSSTSSGSSADDLFVELELFENYSNAAYAQVVNYDLNYTSKQLSQICDYYGIRTNKRVNKKCEIIQLLVAFETTQTNYEIVARRKQLWNYMSELKNDKFMKKFVIWQ